jgi:hypothetical protein
MDDAQAVPTYLLCQRAWSIRLTYHQHITDSAGKKPRRQGTIREGCTKRVLGMIEDLADNAYRRGNRRRTTLSATSSPTKTRSAGWQVRHYAEFGAVAEEASVRILPTATA